MNPEFGLHVDCYKITNWLQDRKKLPKDWQSLLKAAQAKLSVLTEQKGDQLRQFSHIHRRIIDQAQNFNYKDLAWVCEQLKSTPLAAERNILNQYTNPLLKEWLALKTFMDKNLLGLTNCAKFINQVLKFEIPGLKKANQNISSQIGMLRRKIDSNNNNISLQKQEFKKECRALGIQGQNIRLEIPQLIEQLPTIFNIFEDSVRKAVPKALELYQGFCAINQAEKPSFPMLSYFVEFGDDVLDIYKGAIQDESAKERLRKNKYKNFKASTTSASKEWGIVVGQQAAEEEAPDTMLSVRESRLQLLLNLNQLLYFLKARAEEAKSSSSNLMLSTAYSKYELTANQLAELVQAIESCVSLITNDRNVELLNLAHNPQTFDRIVKRLERFAKQEAKCLDDIQNLKQKIQELEKSEQSNKVKITFYKDNVLEVKKSAEQLLTALMKRDVNVVGDINKLQFM